MYQQIPEADDVLPRFAALKNTVVRRMSLPWTQPGDDALNKTILDKITRAETIAETYFTSYAPLLTTSSPLSEAGGRPLRQHVRNFSEAWYLLDGLMQEMDNARNDTTTGLSPLFAMKVKGEHGELKHLNNLLSDVWMYTALHITAREKTFTAAERRPRLVVSGSNLAFSTTAPE